MAKKKKEIWVTRKGKAATQLDAIFGDATRLTGKKKPTKKPKKK